MVFRPPSEEKIPPYVDGGVGLYAPEGQEAGLWPFGGSSRLGFGFHMGGGMEYFFKNNLSLVVGVRFHKIFNSIPSNLDFPVDKNVTYINIYAGLNHYLKKK